MLATISPADVHHSETLGTLKYVERAKKIVNRVQVNEDRQEALVRHLRQEIAALRAQLRERTCVGWG